MHSAPSNVLNPKTNRFINVGTQKYKRLIAEGVIQPAVEPGPVPEAVCERPTAALAHGANRTPAGRPEAIQQPTPDFKVKLMETATDVVKENVGAFTPDLTQEQCDRLLKKLLFDKLCLGEKKPKPRSKKKKKI